jgi:hypothetical protein
VPRAALTGRLGVFVPLPALHPDDHRLVNSRLPVAQSTWYAEMAAALTTRHT